MVGGFAKRLEAHHPADVVVSRALDSEGTSRRLDPHAVGDQPKDRAGLSLADADGAVEVALVEGQLVAQTPQRLRGALGGVAEERLVIEKDRHGRDDAARLDGVELPRLAVDLDERAGTGHPSPVQARGPEVGPAKGLFGPPDLDDVVAANLDPGGVLEGAVTGLDDDLVGTEVHQGVHAHGQLPQRAVLHVVLGGEEEVEELR